MGHQVWHSTRRTLIEVTTQETRPGRVTWRRTTANFHLQRSPIRSRERDTLAGLDTAVYSLDRLHAEMVLGINTALANSPAARRLLGSSLVSVSGAIRHSRLGLFRPTGHGIHQSRRTLFILLLFWRDFIQAKSGVTQVFLSISSLPLWGGSEFYPDRPLGPASFFKTEDESVAAVLEHGRSFCIFGAFKGRLSVHAFAYGGWRVIMVKWSHASSTPGRCMIWVMFGYEAGRLTAFESMANGRVIQGKDMDISVPRMEMIALKMIRHVVCESARSTPDQVCACNLRSC